MKNIVETGFTDYAQRCNEFFEIVPQLLCKKSRMEKKIGTNFPAKISQQLAHIKELSQMTKWYFLCGPSILCVIQRTVKAQSCARSKLSKQI